MKRNLYLTCALWLCLGAIHTLSAQNTINLQGEWRFAIDCTTEGIMPRPSRCPARCSPTGKATP